MTLHEIYEIIRQKYSRILEIDEYNAILRGVNLRKLNKEAAKFEEGQRVIDVLSFLKESDTLTIDVDGIADLPKYYFRRASVSKDGVDIQVLMEDELQEVLQSPIYPPSATEAVCVFRSGTIQFYPVDLDEAEIIFLRYPETPEYVHKEDDGASTGVSVYDPDNSTEFEWPVSEHMDLMDMILAEVEEFFAKKSQVEQINR